MRYSLRHLAAGMALGFVLAACGTSLGSSPASEGTAGLVEPAPLETAPYTPITQPDLLEIPKLNINTHMIGLGLTDDLEHEVPAKAEEAGWYEGSVKPGDVGVAIILGHINSGGVDGVFSKLPDLVAGDEIKVDGLVFKVYETQWAPKTNFPADKVYGKRDKPEVVLVTCGGEFDRATGHYKDNFVVYGAVA